ncbi:MAG TPA: hypothetical protein VK154_04150 [Chitinophagales bacterium]|nr:hypothetical protein [Chitinophagales bacterium]
MMGYPVSKEDLEKEIKYREGIYKILANTSAQQTAEIVKQHIETLKARLKALEVEK